MIVGELSNGLGNQMFTYAATKSIVADLGFDYAYWINTVVARRRDPTIDRFGIPFFSDFECGLQIDRSERLPAQSSGPRWTWHRLPGTNYNPGVYEINDGTHLNGCFQSPRYFEGRRRQVLAWFDVAPETRLTAERRRGEIENACGSSHLVALHMRYGADTRYYRVTINPAYYRAALARMRAELGHSDFGVVLFADDLRACRRLLGPIPVHEAGGDAFEDLALMTLCDSHIVAHSTFSWWGAWLAEGRSGPVIRPSIFPLNDGTMNPTDIYPADWLAVEASREAMSPRLALQRIHNQYLRDARESAVRFSGRLGAEVRRQGGALLRHAGIRQP